MQLSCFTLNDKKIAMKKSVYNRIINQDGQPVLYNIHTEKLCIMDVSIADLYTKSDPKQISESHPTFYNYLVVNKFIIPDSTIEFEDVIKQWNAEDNNSSCFSLTINPTLNCNLSCWYCYENHIGNLLMSKETLASVMKLISKQMTNEALQNFNLSFFGGEPLLGFDKIVKPIINHCDAECKRHGKSLSISFVTNGVLLNEYILSILNSYNRPISFQITLDGDMSSHNIVRKTKSGAPTYTNILNNCKKILSHESMYLTLRCNFTAQNISTFLNVTSDCKLAFSDVAYPAHLTFDFHRVWQDIQFSKQNSQEISEQENNIKDLIRQAGFNVSANKEFNKSRCYADRKNHMVVNFDGNVFRCTARDFTAQNAEGILTSEGEIIWNYKSQKRDSIKWINHICHNCIIFPLCGGNCSQSKLESSRHDICYHGYTEQEKINIITKRFKWLIFLAKSDKHNL